MKHEFRRMTALLLVICMVMGLLCLDTGVVRAEETTNTVDVTVYVGRTYTITDTTGNYESTYTGDGLETSIATVAVSGTTTAASSTTTYSGTQVTSATNGSTYYVGNGTNYLVLSNGSLSTTTDITQATEFTWTNDKGKRYLSSDSYYLRYSNGAWSVTNRDNDATNFNDYNSSGSLSVTDRSQTTSTGYALYTMDSTTVTVPASEATTIAITGVAAGETTVVVGNTTYKITVLDNAPTSFTGDVSIAGGESTTVTLSDLDQGTYGAFSEDYYDIVWTTADSTIADIYGTSITGASIIGHAEGETTVTATVYYKDTTNVAATYTWTVTVTSDSNSTGDNTFTMSTKITVYNGRLYYSVTGSTVQEGELISTTTDENGNTVRTYEFDATANYSSSAIFFYFVAPDDGYALTSIADDGTTAGAYYVLDTTNNTVYNYTTSNWSSMTSAEITAMLTQAVANGCTVIYWNTRNTSNGTSGSISYTNWCNKLPTVSKKITTVTHNCDGSGDVETYVEGKTTIEVGDVITYTITVTTYYEKVSITYSNVTLTDTMSGQAGSPSWSTETVDTSYMGNGSVQSEASTTAYTTTVTYTVQEGDINKTITNSVELSYDYYTNYQEGSYDSTSTAEATITITSFYPKGLVLDYGLPMEIDYSASHGYGTLTSGTANYGTVSIVSNVVTYTPNTILTSVDTVTLTANIGTTETKYTFNVYPATTVYYEEGFASYGTGWSVTSGGSWISTGSKGTSTQQAHTANDTNTSAASTYNNYGYDDAYTDDTGASEGTAATTATVGDSLSFTFTGTGVDIFANCDSGSGMVAIRVADSNGTIKKFLFVDMANTGDYAVSGTAYNTPIASVSGLEHGSYTVTIYLITASSTGFSFDGFRVYDTIEQSDTAGNATTDPYTIQNTVYLTDDEDYPVFYELRNNVLAGLSVATDTDSSVYADDLSDAYAQVYASSETTDGAVVLYDTGNKILKSDGTTEVTSENVQSLLDNGPKNELYLYPGGSVAFKVTTNREVQIGMRSVTGASVTYSISAVDESGGTVNIAGATTGKPLSSSVDMFYDLVDKDSNGETTTCIITITNNSSSAGVLSITDIKVCDSNDGSLFEELTAEDLVTALTAAASDEDGTTSGDDAQAEAAEEPAVTYADTTLTVNLSDYTGSVIATTSLTENGVEGEETAFAASDILAAVEEVLPTGYALVSADDIADQTAVYGEDGSLTLQIGKVATLTVSCVKYTGLFRTTTVATFTLTKVQTSRSSRATFSASEIKAAIPADCRALLVTSASVNYGSIGSKTVTVY